VRGCTGETCVPTNVPDTTPCTNGMCMGGVCKLSTGKPCLGPNDCLSMNCPMDDDVCCDLPCAGLCKSCALGSCVDVPAGTDPYGECSVAGSLNCNGNGMCGP
jgi:hypothetical protein